MVRLRQLVGVCDVAASLRRLLTIPVALGLLVMAAGSAAASNVRAGADQRGVTKEEIKLGVTYVDLSQLRNVVSIEFGDWRKIYDAVIDDVNAKRGVNGRKIAPVYAPVQPVGTVPAQEACAKLTEDEHVFAVTGFFLADAPLCYVEQHGTPVVGGSQTKENLARAKAPWFTLEPGDRVYSNAIDAFAAEGVFKGGKLGIIVDAPFQGTFDNVVAPALKRNKIKGGTVANITATTGDNVATEQQAGVIAERFQSQKINKVLLVGTSTLQFANVLAKTDYRPRLIVPNFTSLRAFVQNPGSALPVAESAIGAYPATNFNDPALQECFKAITKATGYQIKERAAAGEPDYRSSSEIACRAVGLFAAIAGGAGKDLTATTFGKAPRKLGSVKVPGSGDITYDAKTRSFVQPVHIWRYDPAAKTLVPDEKPAA
jgi:ABC-type branched-subunit amino acid transport system substrate-binding protein